jgi:PIN domain nuclease of toxin-antitoxin system
MKVRYLLDTHTLVFFVLTPHKLGPKARKVFADAKPGELGISATTVAELGQLIHSDRIEFEGHPDKVFGPVLDALVQVPLSLSAALQAPALGLPHGDPADRLIAATALDLGVPLVTKDGNITDSGIVRVVW